MAAPVAERQDTSRLRLGLAAALVSGMFLAVQQRLNGGLQEAVGDAVLVATVSFAAGLVLALAVLAVRRRSRLALPLLRTLPGWWLLGGLSGAVLVTIGASAAPQVGVALLTVGLVGGQTVGGVLVDGVGLGPGGRRPLTAYRAVGAALCLSAIVFSTRGQSAHPKSSLLLLVVVAGLLGAVQLAVNGRVGRTTGDVTVTVLQSYAVGTLALLAGLAGRAALTGVRVGHWPDQWWLYLGGPLGVLFVGIAAVVVQQIGVLRLGLVVTAGQLLGALALDATVPEHGHGVALTTVLGAGVTLLAVVVSGRS